MPETLTKEQQALIDSNTAAIFKNLAPLLEKMAVTPDAMAAAVREANKPYVDPAEIARNLREVQISRKQQEESRQIMKQIQENCPHKHKDGQNALNLQHNFPDTYARGLCPLCQVVISPAHMEIAADGTSFTIPAHPKYFMVIEKESMQ